MKKTIASAWTVFISTALFFTCLVPEAGAQNVQGKWGIGIRGGATFLSQDVAEDVEGKTGPIVSGNILYGISDILSIGFNAEWERHGVEVIGVDLGDATTVSLIPFAEWHAVGLGALSPYFSLGLGFNINSFSRSDFGKLAFTKLDPKNTLALKIGGGADYFATRNLALNAEVGWKANSGEADACSPFVGCGTDDWKMSAISVLLGLRYYF